MTITKLTLLIGRFRDQKYFQNRLWRVLRGYCRTNLNDPFAVGMRHDVALFPEECRVGSLDLQRRSYRLDASAMSDSIGAMARQNETSDLPFRICLAISLRRLFALTYA